MIPLDGLFDINDLRIERDRSKSRIFGFILYSERDPFVSKVLRDDDFWLALDKRSGPNWPIFSVRPNRPYFFNIFQINKHLLETFGINNIKDLPCFVVFIWDDNDELKRFIVKVNGESEHEVYKSLRKIIDTITETESKILDEYKQTENVYREVVNNLRNSRFQVFGKDIGDLLHIIQFIRCFI